MSARLLARIAGRAACLGACMAPLAAHAALTMTCEGTGWTLDLMESQARLDFPSPTRMDIPHTARAEGADWPIAMTLIGDRDTAIVLVHDRACASARGTGSHEVQILTQRAQSPILLTGCCREALR